VNTSGMTSRVGGDGVIEGNQVFLKTFEEKALAIARLPIEYQPIGLDKLVASE
jgi:hypothetical protein